VPQYKLADIGKHPEVSVELPSLARWATARSVTVQPVADPRTHSTQVRINLSANEAGVYPGMFVRAYFTVGKAQRLLVPTTAVLHRGEVVAVYVVGDKGRLELRQVRLGDPNGQNEVEVVAGLNPGERVAVDAVKAGMAEAEQNK
jgi:membrane fusion protein, multidrug efflux system